MHQLSIDTEVLSKPTELQLRLLLVQVSQLLVALYRPGLCKYQCKHDATDIGCLTRCAGAGVTLAPGPHPALRVGVSGTPGAVVLHPGAGVIQVILKWFSSKLLIG